MTKKSVKEHFALYDIRDDAELEELWGKYDDEEGSPSISVISSDI